MFFTFSSLNTFLVISVIGIIQILLSVYYLGKPFAVKSYRFEIFLIFAYPIFWIYLGLSMVIWQYYFDGTWTPNQMTFFWMTLYGTLVYVGFLVFMFLVRFIRIRWVLK